MAVLEARAVVRVRPKMSHIDRTPEQRALIVTPGVGKTETALDFLAGNWEKKFADKRVYFFVPDHTVAAEILERAMKKLPASAQVRVRRGMRDTRGGDSLCHPDMHSMVDYVQDLGGQASELVCPSCPLYETCGWQAQQRNTAPGLIILPHAYLPLPLGHFDIAIIDEEFVLALERSVSVRVERYNPRFPVIIPNNKNRGWYFGNEKYREASDTLQEAYQALWNASESGTVVPTLPSLRRSGLTPDLCKRASSVEYGRAEALNEKLKNEIERGGTAAEIEERMKFVRATDGDAWRKAKIWQSLGRQLALPEPTRETLNGWTLTEKLNADGGSDRVFVVDYRASSKIEDKPVIAMDASGSLRLISTTLPHLKQARKVHADAPHTRVIQITDKKNSMSALIDKETDTAGTRQEKANRRRRIAEFAEVVSGGAQTALISYMGIEDSPEFAALPDNILRGHYGLTRGQNRWGKVRTLIVAGRIRPNEKACVRTAGALFYDQPEAVSLKAAGIGNASGAYAMRGADGVEFWEGWVEAHPDPLANLILQQIMIAELEQAIGRGRGVRRTVDDPLTVYVLGNSPIPNILVDELVEFDDLKASKLDLNFAQTGWDLDVPAHTFKMFPGVFETPEAARKAYQRARSGTSPYRMYSIRGMSHSSEIEYRLAGAGQKLATGRIDLRRVHDPRAELERALGPLTYFKIKNPPDAKDHQPVLNKPGTTPRTTE